MNKEVQVVADTDELGELEEFTWDLFPAVSPQETTHLNSEGLPKLGTHIVPGMIVVGKIGKTRNYDASKQPTALEIHGLSFEELRSRFGSMWNDSSLYADSQTAGIVKEAYLEDYRGKKRAVVVIERDNTSTPAISGASSRPHDDAAAASSHPR
jgi:DNA-directed RNA polymerase beta subunit